MEGTGSHVSMEWCLQKCHDHQNSACLLLSHPQRLVHCPRVCLPDAWLLLPLSPHWDQLLNIGQIRGTLACLFLRSEVLHRVHAHSFCHSGEGRGWRLDDWPHPLEVTDPCKLAPSHMWFLATQEGDFLPFLQSWLSGYLNWETYADAHLPSALLTWFAWESRWSH